MSYNFSFLHIIVVENDLPFQKVFWKRIQNLKKCKKNLDGNNLSHMIGIGLI